MQYDGYSVSTDFKLIQQEFAGSTPFNIVKDIRELSLSEEDLGEIAKNVSEELKAGDGRTSNQSVYFGYKRLARWAKIRVADVQRKTGKSSGYRCIVLVDEKNKFGYILHLYLHSSIINISQQEKNQLKKLVDEYIDNL